MMPFVSHREEWHHRLSNLEFRRSGSILGLQGPAGIGKSFAARAALNAAKLRFAVFAANESDPTNLARGWMNALGARLRHLPQWAQSNLHRWMHGEALEGDDLEQTLASCARNLAPFAVLVEDWHEALEAQVQRLEIALRALRGLPGIGVIVTSRHALPSNIDVIDLEPLTRAQSSMLLASEFPDASALPASLQDWVWERSRGNPLFVLEYIRDLRRRGHVWFDGQSWQWREPPLDRRPVTIEALIERALDRVTDADAIRVLEARALLGEHDDPTFWQRVTDLDPTRLRSALRELERLDVMRETAFAHPLYREVSLERMGHASRRDMAARACRYLQERDPIRAAELAELAGFDATRTLELHLRAVASLASDPTRAALQKARACEYADGETRLRLALEAARVLIQTNLKPVPGLTESILREHPRHLEALGLRARALARQGAEHEAYSGLERIPPEQRDREWHRWYALALVEASQLQTLHHLVLERPELHLENDAEIATGIAQALARQGRLDAASAVLERSLQRNDQPEARARLMLAQGTMLNFLRRPLDAEAHLQRTLRDYSSHIPKRLLVNAWLNLGIFAHQLHHLEDAAHRYQTSARLALEVGDQHRYLSAQGALGGLYFDLGEFEAAEQALLEGRSLLMTLRPVTNLIEHDGWLSDLYTCWLPPHGAALSLKYAHSGLRLARQQEDQRVLFHALYFAVQAESEHGNPDIALNLAEEMAKLPHDPQDEFLILSARGSALSMLGRKAEAIAEFERGLALIADQPERDISFNQLQLELDVLRDDESGARKRLEFFEAKRFGPGIAMTKRCFPRLERTATRPDSKSNLRLEVLGPMRLLRDGEVIALRGAKRKTLLALLLEAHLSGHQEARSADLCDALYPNATDEEARAAIKQLVFQLRSQLEADSLRTTTNGYALNGVQSDAQDFLENGDPSLWRGAYLVDVLIGSAHTLEPIREALYSQLRRRAEGLIGTNPTESSRLARILLEVEPFDADALALALRALQAQGNYSSLTKMYRRSRETWLEVGERLPERWAEFLVDAAD
jgi:DNA-binding SARP family transcriptional activator